MAVKASANITISFMVDIMAVYRYYKLQASTASPPSVPTTNPPPSGWNDAEPSYTSGSTNSLYFVDLTVFTNNTFLYSPVSLSSSYEAAKLAYNEAIAAQSAASQAQTAVNESIEDYNSKIGEINDSLSSNLNNANDNLSKLSTDYDDLSKNFKELNDSITNISDSIANLVIGDDGKSLMEQTSDGWRFSIKSRDDQIDSIKDTIKCIEIKEVDGSPVIFLSSENSDFKLAITNSEIRFMDGTNIPAYISNKKLNIYTADIENELRFGSFVWLNHGSGNIGLMWRERG